ncbi:MAG: hypothetical protein IPL61_10515 [Myxococcales bacterium]|nr:hypothetical protein [Myxococcales bacterium]
MRSALATVPAAYQAGFDLDRDEFYVSYDRAAGAPADAARPMIAAIRQAGFDPWLKGPGWPDVAPEVVVLPAID